MDSSRGFVGSLGPAPEIPVLKKKDEERKGGGVAAPWSASAGGSGAALGSLIVQAPSGSSLANGILGLGPLARALSNFFGGPATHLGALFASDLGALILAGGILSWAGLVGMAGMSLLLRERPGQRASPYEVFPTQAPMPAPKIVIDAPRNRSLDYVVKANKGELAFDEEHPLAPKDAPAPAAPETPKAGATGAEEKSKAKPQVSAEATVEAVKKALGAEGLTQKAANGSSFAAGATLGANKMGTSNFELKKTFASEGTGLKLTSFQKRQMRGLDGMATRKLATGANAAMGQLKFANTKSQRAYETSQAAAAKQTATDAFEQSKTTGGEDDMTLGVSDGTGDAVVPASTTSDVKDIEEADTSNSTPYQDEVDEAQESSDNAGTYKAIGIALLIAGAALIVTGIGMLNCTTFPIGLALIGAGTALMVLGAVFLAMGMNEVSNAEDNASTISEDYGQSDQSSTVSDCANESYDTGTSACTEDSDVDTSSGNSVSEDTSSASSSTSAS